MNFEIVKKETYTLVTSKVEKLDTHSATDLKTEFVAISNTLERNIIIDLSATRYCDSSGLNAILTGNRLCKNSKGSFIITGLNTSIKKIISISQLNKVLKIIPTLPEAIDYLFMEEIERQLDDQE